MPTTVVDLAQHLGTVINAVCHQVRENLPACFVRSWWDDEQISITPCGHTRPEVCCNGIVKGFGTRNRRVHVGVPGAVKPCECVTWVPAHAMEPGSIYKTQMHHVVADVPDRVLCGCVKRRSTERLNGIPEHPIARLMVANEHLDCNAVHHGTTPHNGNNQYTFFRLRTPVLCLFEAFG